MMRQTILTRARFRPDWSEVKSLGNPRFSSVVVDLAKLADYCLNDQHPRGRHKARVFRSRLGLTSAGAGWLKRTLEEAAANSPGELQAAESDSYGDRYLLDVEVQYRGRVATVRCAWIVRRGERMLRLTTCYVL